MQQHHGDGRLRPAVAVVVTERQVVHLILVAVLLALHLLLLPLTIVKTIGWWAVLATALNVLMLLGIQGISEAMEEPFGKDDDDLKLDEFCNAIEKQVHAQVNWILENKYDAYHGVQDRDSSKRRGEDVGAKASLGWRVGAGAGEQNLGSTGVSTALPERDIHARAGAAT